MFWKSRTILKSKIAIKFHIMVPDRADNTRMSTKNI